MKDVSGKQAIARRLALIDDDVDVAEALREFLEGFYEVSMYTSGHEFLDWVKQNRDLKFDVILTDFNMPKLSGLEMMKQLHELNYDVPAVAFSGYLTKEVCLDLNTYGVYRLIEKPANFDLLLSSIEDVLSIHQRKSKLDYLEKTILKLKEAFDVSQVLGGTVISDEHPLKQSFDDLDHMASGLIQDIREIKNDELQSQQRMAKYLNKTVA